ncbi:MBL fold metallo-hydrolase [bacterium]|nr:MBL fold metallo-hydrolase [bacterium]
MKNADFKVKFWGVRGSYPVCDKKFLKYGGNTACVEVLVGNHRIIIDGGTGIIPLGDKIFQEHISSADNIYDRTPMNITLLLSHIHQDHIQGLNFFKPINVFTTRFSLYGYSGFDSNLDETLSELIYGKSFPINLYDVTADYSITDITESDVLILKKNDISPVLKKITSAEDVIPQKDEVIISFMKSNSHPNFGVMCFKIAYNDKSIVYASDTECYSGGSKKLELFAKDTDLLIHDSQYTTEDYLSVVFPKQGFGHSTFNMAYDIAKASNAKKMAFYHFDPAYNDEKLTNIENFFKNKNKDYFFAKEGLEVCI